MPKTATKDKKTASKGGGDDLTQKVLAMREQKKTWAEISSTLGIGQGRAMGLALKAGVAPKERIKFTDDDDLATQVVDLRNDQKLSWGIISIRSGVGEAKLKRLFSEASGTPALGHRIGKGGRFPTGAERPAASNGSGKAAKSGKSAKSTKAGGRESAPKSTKSTKASKGGKKSKAGTAVPEGVGPASSPATSTKKPLVEYSLEELQARLSGKVITVGTTDGGSRRIAVKSVRGLKEGQLDFFDNKGKNRTVTLAAITKASR